jgi:hypothetical protein
VAKLWDDLMKMLAGANPQHLVSWLLPGAHFEKELVTELKNRTIEADLLSCFLLQKHQIVGDASGIA